MNRPWQRAAALMLALLVQCASMMLLLSPQRRAVDAPAREHAAFVLLLQQPQAQAVAQTAVAQAPPRATSAARRPARIAAPSAGVVEVPATSAPPEEVVSTAPFAPAELPSAADIMRRAKRDLRTIDQEILGRVKAVPANAPDSARMRLAQGMANAFVGVRAETIDHYTSPDGVVYTRTTSGSRSTCHMSGTGSFTPATRSGGGWRQVNCPPADSGWVK